MRVAVLFSGQQVIPVWFYYRSRKVWVGQIVFRWQTQEGNAQWRHFRVVQGLDAYTLSFNPQTLSWRLSDAQQDP